MTESRKNIVLIAIDALRADLLSCYGYNRNTSPNIDDLGRKGVVLENAFCCTNTTDPSFTSIFSGKYPISHGIRNHGEKVTDNEIRNFYKREISFLSEILRDEGYLTLGMDWLGRWHKKGFEYYFGDYSQKKSKNLSGILNKLPNIFSERVIRLLSELFKKIKKSNYSSTPTATELTDKAVELISTCDKPFFLFIHYWDTHTPYNAPESIYEEFKPNKKGEKLEKLFEDISNEKWKGYLLRSAGRLSTAEEVIAMYDSAIRYVDMEIGKLIKHLQNKDIYDDTIFIITSDHGESLTDHGIYFDHHGLYNASIKVPLIFNNLPEKEKRIKSFVQHVDILPTILDVLNIKFKEFEFDGKSLLPLIRGEVNSIRSHIVSEEFYTENKMAIVNDHWKYIHSPSEEEAKCRYCGTIHGGVEELYNLEEDPEELKNVIREYPETANNLRKNLFQFIEGLERKKTKKEKKEIGKKVKELKFKDKI